MESTVEIDMESLSQSSNQLSAEGPYTWGPRMASLALIRRRCGVRSVSVSIDNSPFVFPLIILSRSLNLEAGFKFRYP